MLTLHKLHLTGAAGTVKLTAAEATLLMAFSDAADARIAYSQVAQCLGVPMSDEARSNIQIRMVRLRKKLHEAGAQGAVVESVRNVGYQFFDQLTVIKA